MCNTHPKQLIFFIFVDLFILGLVVETKIVIFGMLLFVFIIIFQYSTLAVSGVRGCFKKGLGPLTKLRAPQPYHNSNSIGVCYVVPSLPRLQKS